MFLEANPTEIVTIFIEDYVTSPMGLTKVFNASGLSQYLFPLSRMPKNGSDWPTVDDMAQKNQRLVVFTSKKTKEVTEGIAYEWNYVVENQCEYNCVFSFVNPWIAFIYFVPFGFTGIRLLFAFCLHSCHTMNMVCMLWDSKYLLYVEKHIRT